MARFIIADITDPRSIPQELSGIVKDLPSVPIQPVLALPSSEYGMFEHLKYYSWVLPTFHYVDSAHLLSAIVENVIVPAEAKILEIRHLKLRR